MNTQMKTGRHGRLLTMALLAAVTAGSVLAQEAHRGTIATRDRSYAGDIRWRPASRVYAVTAWPAWP